MSPLCIGLVSSSLLPIAVLNLSLLSISPPSWLLLFPGFSALLPSIFSGVYESFWLTECRRNFWIFPKDFSPGLQSTLIPYWGSLLCYSLLTPFTSPISCKTFFSLALENIPQCLAILKVVTTRDKEGDATGIEGKKLGMIQNILQ